MNSVFTLVCSFLSAIPVSIYFKHNTKLRACGIESYKGALRLLVKKSPPPPPANPHASGSIFLRQPLHLSIRSRVVALCLNISFVSASVAGGYRSVIGLVLGHSWLVSFPLASKRFSSGSCGLSVPFQSSLFRGLFFKYPREDFVGDVLMVE